MKQGIVDPPQFIDLFAGCGGISLGLAQAGWQGLFAIEKGEDAFLTFKSNFLQGPAHVRFQWPNWLGQSPHSIADVIAEHGGRVRGLRGQVALVAGGPPCQGFSLSGRRNVLDPRNRLFEKYVEFVDDVRPKAVLLENVPGMRALFGSTERKKQNPPGPKPKTFLEKLILALDEIGYVAAGRVLEASKFGVPQRRPRLVVIGLQKELAARIPNALDRVFENVESCRLQQLEDLELPDQVSAGEAISDLEIGKRRLVDCLDPASPRGFKMSSYGGPKTHYQRMMHKGVPNEAMDSMRLARHGEVVSKRFKKILEECRRGVNLSDRDRARLGLKKFRTVPMNRATPSPTITTLPDDMLHYKEPRILTVRECARLQSFPDWFKFCGKYTTGGDRRKVDLPRYTQVGNAVPPFLSMAIGKAIVKTIFEASSVEEEVRKLDFNWNIDKGLVIASG